MHFIEGEHYYWVWNEDSGPVEGVCTVSPTHSSPPCLMMSGSHDPAFPYIDFGRPLLAVEIKFILKNHLHINNAQSI